MSNNASQIERRGAWLAVLLATLLAAATFSARAEGPTSALDNAPVVQLAP